MMCQGRMAPEKVNEASAAAASIITDWVMMSTLRRGTRSASTPAHSMKSQVAGPRRRRRTRGTPTSG